MLKKLLFVIISLLIANICNAYEECDYKFYNGIPTRTKIIEKKQDGTNIADIYFVDTSDNLLNGFICKYEGKNLILKLHVINGKINGIGQSYYSNGNIRWITEYKNGIPNGYSKYYNKNGKFDKTFQYINGIVISSECANGYKWNDNEVYKWNQGDDMRNSVRDICIKK